MEQLGSTDTFFFAHENSRVPCMIGNLMIVDPSTSQRSFIRHKDILEYLKKRMHLSRLFRQRLITVPGNLVDPFWIEDKNFDIEYHVRHIALPQPGDWRQLCILAARIYSREMDLTRPLWELTIIEGLDNLPGAPEGSFAVLTKFHHAIADGVTGLSAIQALQQSHPDEIPAPPEKHWTPERTPTPFELLAKSIPAVVKQPVKNGKAFVRVVRKVAETAFSISKEELVSPPRDIPQTRFNAAVSPHRVFDSVPLSLDELKSIRAVTGNPTINDIVLTIVAGGLRKYLLAHDELPKQSLVNGSPISVRPPEMQSAGGNMVSMMAVELGTDVEDHLQRLTLIKERTLQGKQLVQSMGPFMLNDATSILPTWAMVPGIQLMNRAQAGVHFPMALPKMFNLITTNVAGPREDIYFAGGRVVTAHPLGPLFDGLGLIHPVSGMGKMTNIGIVACRALLPDVDFYASCLQEAYAELCSAALQPSGTRRPRTKKNNSQGKRR